MQKQINLHNMSIRKNIKNLLLFLTPCFMFLLMSCQSSLDDTIAPEGQGTVTFSVSNYRQVSFDDISSSTVTTRAETISMTLANLSLTVFDADTKEIVSPTVLHKSDDYMDKPLEFSQFSVSLPYGRYRILVLGYNGKKACNIASLNHISWADDYVPNTFLYQEEFTLSEGSNLNKEITLKHVVAAFRVKAEDAIPAELKAMRFTCSVGGTVLDAMTGLAKQSTGRTSEISVPNSYVGTEGLDFTAYLFLPSEQTNGSYTVQALGQGNAVLYEKRFNDVPLRINYLTTWQGKVFEKSDDDVPSVQPGFNVKWDMDWADTILLTP